MKLVAMNLYRYAVPLIQPLSLKGAMLRHREGILVELTSESGAKGWGEASPLPGFSRESLDDAGSRLRELAEGLVGSEVDYTMTLPDLPPSVRFAFELAVLDLECDRLRVSVPEMLNVGQPELLVGDGANLRVSGLISGFPDAVLGEARRMRGAGYRTVKLKVGRRSADEDAALVRVVKRELGEAVSLRLDANRAWSFEEAEAFARAVEDLDFEYVEEPLADPARLPELAGHTGLPIALDETLVGMELAELGNHRYAQAVILKPTLLGGILRTEELAWRARQLGMKPVISSAYETGIATAALVALAFMTGSGKVAAGLDTYSYLAADVLDPRPCFSAPEINFWEAAIEVAPGSEYLTKIE